MPHEVFVSYSKQDSTVASRICEALEKAGVRCWIAPRDIVPGRNWGASIVQAIGASRVLVLVLSAHSNHSQQVLREVERAVNRNIIVVPYRIDEIEPSAELEYYLSVTHWLNAVGADPEASLGQLLRTVRELLGRDTVERLPGISPAEEDRAPAPVSPLASIERHRDSDIQPDETLLGALSTTFDVQPSAIAQVSDRGPLPRATHVSTDHLRLGGIRAGFEHRGALEQRTELAQPEATPTYEASPASVFGGSTMQSDESSATVEAWIRWLPSGVLVLASIGMAFLPGTNVFTELSYIPAIAIITGFIGPVGSVVLCAARREFPVRKGPAIAILTACSIATPIVLIWMLRQLIGSTGSGGLVVVAANAADAALIPPFSLASFLALAVITLPHRLPLNYQPILISLALVAGVLIVLWRIVIIGALFSIAATANMTGGVGAWIINTLSTF